MKKDLYTQSMPRKGLTTADAIKIAYKYAYCHGCPQEDTGTMRLFYAMCEHALRVHYKLMRYVNPNMQPEPAGIPAVKDRAQEEVNRLIAGIVENEKHSICIKQDTAEYNE